tara:strand:- start:5960 stop:6199 length:240 start_codon:yes stop_codon:yes gene_type:complete
MTNFANFISSAKAQSIFDNIPVSELDNFKTSKHFNASVHRVVYRGVRRVNTTSPYLRGKKNSYTLKADATHFSVYNKSL